MKFTRLEREFILKITKKATFCDFCDFSSTIRNLKREDIYHDKYRGLWKNATYVEKFDKWEFGDIDYVPSQKMSILLWNIVWCIINLLMIYLKKNYMGYWRLKLLAHLWGIETVSSGLVGIFAFLWVSLYIWKEEKNGRIAYLVVVYFSFLVLRHKGKGKGKEAIILINFAEFLGHLWGIEKLI